MACETVTLADLGLAEGYTEEELQTAAAAYVLVIYGVVAVFNGCKVQCDGTVHLCVTE